MRTKAEVNAYYREWYQQNKDKVHGYYLKRIAKDPDYYTARGRKWKADNKDKHKLSNKEWRKNNPEKYAAQMLRLSRKRRGLPEPTRPSPDVCEICSNPPKRKNLHLDHDHETGAFRGWLCVNCNTAIGKLGDNEAGLKRALAYLLKAKH